MVNNPNHSVTFWCRSAALVLTSCELYLFQFLTSPLTSQYCFLSSFLFPPHLSNLSLSQLLSKEYNTSPQCLVYLPEVLIILLHRTRNNNGSVEKAFRSVEFPSVNNSASSDIMRLHLLSCSCDFLFAQELDMGKFCNASDVSSKYRVSGAIFHNGEELCSGASILMRLFFELYMIFSS